eukprot:gnl/MRDRNA2_/MRDRNA2_34012_c0_seq1.p1 gnl/MRDRNA2_/MRDRNA2_34012_c0~~gnl/MRDRNA2_/MRDRNA2_34012_c0_seq1.p1  ORF type:complete len:176 (-),score=37.13 gnl/MRDRNA2_/MRDRNA2_34012_c0_seq1:307-834(-)
MSLTSMVLVVVFLAFPAHNLAKVSSANEFARQHTAQLAQPWQFTKQRDYGPLGNILARLATLGQSATAGVPPGQASSVPASGGTVCAKASRPSEGVTCPVPVTTAGTSSISEQALKGVRELLKMLWSNFLPDPTFDRAISALIQRDQHLGMDAEEGEGGFITAVQKEMILSVKEV